MGCCRHPYSQIATIRTPLRYFSPAAKVQFTNFPGIRIQDKSVTTTSRCAIAIQKHQRCARLPSGLERYRVTVSTRFGIIPLSWIEGDGRNRLYGSIRLDICLSEK